MKKVMMVLFCMLVVLMGAQVEARRAEVNLALPSTMAPSGTSPFGISSISQDAYMFALLGESSSGTSDFILSTPRGMVDANWSISVVSLTRTTSNEQAAYTLSYKVGDVDNTSVEWGELPLIPIISGVSTDSGATPYPVYFNPPPGKYLRFYVTSGTTPAYSTFTAKLTVTEYAKVIDPNTYIRPSITYTGDAQVRSQPGFFHGIWVSGLVSGVTVCAYDIASGATSGTSTLFPETYIPLSGTNPYGIVNSTPPIIYDKGIHVDITGTGAVSYKVYYRDMTN